ncbi:hypothetical protein AGOR_G00140890 [Albula goreensis]|uniref:Uncharacterized protein n=1 Tax=Albula goreensis TaxID=1534307 RepID=A0A8T3DBN2_9TELE|nr:hypothetical protein AGOR_G00140890 [Albula goreensis]
MMNNFVKVSLPLKQNDKQISSPNASQSGTGVFYQAMPAVGADGKNVMKLIPVQRVNGQFVRMQTSSNLPSTYKKGEGEPQRLFARPIHLSPSPVSHSNVPILQPAINGRYILKRPSDVNVMLNPVAGTGKYNDRVTLSNSTPIQVQVPVPIVATKVAQSMPMASPILNSGKTLTLLNKKQLPVTVKSPVLPNGHYLQIPPNAQVKTLPASALPQAIKKRILTPPVSSTTSASSSATNLPTVVYVSPVNTMKLGASPQAPAIPPAPMSLNRFPKPCGKSLAMVGAGTSSAPPLKPAQKESRDPVTPMKWVVQEQSDSAGPCLVPQNSSSMTSEILKALAQMEKANTIGQSCASKTVTSQENPAQIGPGKDNALVMCNGKVYFVAKKTPEFSDHSPEMQRVIGGIGSPSKHTMGDNNINQRNKLSSLSLLPSSVPGLPAENPSRKDAGHIVINDGPDDIIDLCDDEIQDQCMSQSQPSTSALAVPGSELSQSTTEDDEDSNVIFVSYIPPKSSTDSAGGEIQIDQEQEAIQGTMPEEKTVPENEQDHEKATSPEKEIHQESVTAQEVQTQKNMEACQDKECEMEKQSVSSTPAESRISDSEKNTVDANLDHQVEPTDFREHDLQLKHRFGITSDVKICLQKINSTETKAVPKKSPRISSINKRTLDGIRKLMQGSRIEVRTKKYMETQASVKEKDECSPHVSKRKKEGPPESTDKAEDSGSTRGPDSADTDTTMERVNTPGKAISPTEGDTSATGLEHSEPDSASTDTVTEVRPAVMPSATQEADIKMENLSTVSRNIPKSKGGRPKSLKGKSKSKVPERRLETANPEQETMETSPFPRNEASFSKLEITGESSKTDTPEVVKQDEEPTEEPTSVEICCPSVLSESSSNTAGEPPGGDLFIATPMDPEEIKRHEKIKRLKELLKEKEAALEMIRKNMI